jgi:hypothetical protein
MDLADATRAFRCGKLSELNAEELRYGLQLLQQQYENHVPIIFVMTAFSWKSPKPTVVGEK